MYFVTAYHCSPTPRCISRLGCREDAIKEKRRVAEERQGKMAEEPSFTMTTDLDSLEPHSQILDSVPMAFDADADGKDGGPDEVDILGKQYQYEEMIGCGAFGRVIKARNKVDRLYYAIKIIKIVQDHKRTIHEEVHKISRLEHPNIVRYINSWQQRYEKCMGDQIHDLEESESMSVSCSASFHSGLDGGGGSDDDDDDGSGSDDDIFSGASHSRHSLRYSSKSQSFAFENSTSYDPNQDSQGWDDLPSEPDPDDSDDGDSSGDEGQGGPRSGSSGSRKKGGAGTGVEEEYMCIVMEYCENTLQHYVDRNEVSRVSFGL
jgi:serine/threonine protein kinase